jgi:hypothetical protein
MTTAKGIIKVLKIPRKRKFFPGKRRRAKAYATSELDNNVATTPFRVINEVLRA